MNRYSTSHASRMNWLLGGAAAGLLAMYFGDQEHGRRRRALAADKLRSAAARSGDAVDVASRDLGNRLQGLRAQATRMVSRGSIAVDDDVLVARVRQRVGRVVSHPRAIEVSAHQGNVILAGPVFAHERRQLVSAVNKVLGVNRVDDRLEEHEKDDGIARLQGGGKPRAAAMRGLWSPGMRAAAAVGGGALAAYGMKRGSAMRLVSTLSGAGLIARSMINSPLLHIVTRGGRRIKLNKTMHIAAAPETVFDLWSRYDNFPQFMSTVRQVTDLGDGRSHWTVSGPAGMRLEWDARLTASERPHVLAWESEPGASVQNSGMIRFQPAAGGTRVSVHMSYVPPSGYIGHALTALFNGDPKRQMDEDLMRMKQFIETGRPPHDAAQASARQPGTRAAVQASPVSG